MSSSVGIPSHNYHRNVRFTGRPITAKEKDELTEAAKNHQLVITDVDTQNSFMGRPTDPQHVRGAYKIKENLSKLTDAGDEYNVPTVVTMDTYGKGTFKFEKIPETISKRPSRVVCADQNVKDAPSLNQIKEFVSNGGDVLAIEKNNWGFATHRYPDGVLRESFEGVPVKGKAITDMLHEAGVKTAAVYGVVTDMCVEQAVKAFQKAGIKPIVVEDAVKHVKKDVLKAPDNEVFRDVPYLSTEEFINTLKGGLQKVGHA